MGGRNYTYVVTSSNILGGESEQSNDVNVIPAKAPSGMAAPNEVTHDKSSITMKWTNPNSNGASPVLKFILYSKADYESSFTEVYSGMTLSHKVPGLRTGFYY